LPLGPVSLGEVMLRLDPGERRSALGVGGDLVDRKALAAGQGSLITERARRFVEIVRAARQ
jgi:2-dehydro-3-deoxyphosphogluconate aldolase / (4S)-4-hydroxy-2-oxoglutarate aldolase